MGKFDRLILKGWFANQTAAKLVVIAGFMVVLAITAMGIYGLSWSYFTILAAAGEPGKLVASYVLQAAVWVLTGLGALSTMMALNPVVYERRFYRQALSLPIPTSRLAWQATGNLWLSSGWAIFLVLTPILTAYEKAFWIGDPVFLRGFLTILMVLTWGVGLGATLYKGLRMVPLIQTWGKKWVVWLGLGLMVWGSWQLILPKRLFQLYDATDLTAFVSQINSLPLTNHAWPTGWLVEVFVEGQTTALSASVAISLVMFMLFAGLILIPYHSDVRRAAEARVVAGTHTDTTKPSHLPDWGRGSPALLMNDFLGIWRQGRESGYFWFTLLLAGAYAVLVSRIPFERITETKWLQLIYQMVVGGYGYLVLVQAMRFVFPLHYKDNRMGWLLKTAPIPATTLVRMKYVAAIGLLLPIWCVGLTLPLWLPLTVTQVVAMIVILGLMLVAIVSCQLFWGLLHQERTVEQNTEAVSTSSVGMAALGSCLVAIFIASKSFFEVTQGRFTWFSAFLMLTISWYALVKVYVTKRWRGDWWL